MSWTGSKHYGDEELVRMDPAHHPDIVFTGHVHQSPFRQGGSWVDRIGDTWVFSAGRQTAPNPGTWSSSPTERRAGWSSPAGAEIVEPR